MYSKNNILCADTFTTIHTYFLFFFYNVLFVLVVLMQCLKQSFILFDIIKNVSVDVIHNLKISICFISL